jgi:hypothetical protein
MPSDYDPGVWHHHVGYWTSDGWDMVNDHGDWADIPIPGLGPIDGAPEWQQPFLRPCPRCGGYTLDTQPIVSAHPSALGNLRLTVVDGELITEAVPISQQQPGEHLHLAHVVTCRPRKMKTR